MTEEGRRLLAAATARPWRLDGKSPTGSKIAADGPERDVTATYCHGCGGIYHEADAALIVAAVNQYAALLDLWEAAAAAVETYDREGVIDAAHELYVVIEDLRRALPPSRDSTPDPLE